VFFNSIDRDNVIEIRNWLNGGLNLNELGRENATPLMYSVIHDKINAFKYILFVGQADFSLRNNEGMSALDYAAKLGRKDMVSMLL
jgi:ankyrin repeat protein